MIVKNRRRVDFYTHVVATTPEDSSSRRRIWRYGERSFSSMRAASLRGFFTSGRRSRGRRSDLLKLPIVKRSYLMSTITDTQLPLLPLLAGLKANGVTPMKDGLLTALKEIVTNGKTPLSAFY